MPDIRSAFGTGTELLNGLRLMYSRLTSYRCPDGHYVPLTLVVAAEQPISCPERGAEGPRPLGRGAGQSPFYYTLYLFFRF